MTVEMVEMNGISRVLDEAGTHPDGWFQALRAAGREAFERQGVPHAKLEEWRDTNVRMLSENLFEIAEPGNSAEAWKLFEKYSFGKEAAAELVFVNGHYDAMSKTMNLPKGVRVMTLEAALGSDGELLRKHLGKHAKIAEHPFAAVNTGMMEGGAVVVIERGAVCEKPIHLLFLTVAEQGRDARATMTSPRVLVVAEENSESSVVETYAGEGEGLYWTNAVTEIVLAKHAKMDHNKLQQEGKGAYHVALQQVVQESESLFVSHSTSLGSLLTRNDLHVFLGGERAEATLNGLVIAKGEQHIDNHTLLLHEKAHCPSHELYKHVLDDKAMVVFKGKIFVQKDAQKTDSKQTSKALLLSDTAFMNSQPALEIYADDVKCTHGSTTGPVDENAVFYLVSRGLSLAQARHLMTYAFAADITRRIRVAPVRARIEDFMAAQHGLPQDLRITDEARHDVALL